MDYQMLSEQQIKELASALEQAVSEEPEEVSEEEVFKNAIWTVENLDKAVKGRGFPFPSEEVQLSRKAQILNSLCFVVAETWGEITDNPELQALGEQAINTILAELEKVNASS